MKPESRFKARVQRAWKAEGAWVLKTHGSRFSSGVPDLVVVSKEVKAFVELKVETTPVTKQQASLLRAIVRAGGTALVLREHFPGGWRFEDASGVQLRSGVGTPSLADLGFAGQELLGRAH